jgi:DhnA family fructose-bisphosphate aldolase class Ia
MRADNLLVLAFDHVFLGLLPGIGHTENTIAALLPAHPDAIIMQPGVLRKVGSALLDHQVTPILRLDGNRTYLAGEWTRSPEWEIFYTAEFAAKAGAKAAIVNLLVGSPAELSSIKAVATAVEACQDVGMPLLVSAIALNQTSQSTPSDPVANQPFVARLAYELGADFVNAYDVTDPGLVRSILPVCPIPTIMSGGSRIKTHKGLVRWTGDVVREGAAGVCLGRAVWQNPDPGRLTRDLRAAIDSASPISRV